LAKASSLSRLHDQTETHNAWYDSSGRVISNTTRDRQPAELEPEITANERLQTHALDRAATGIGR
jgi:hypothetical protein